MALSALAQHLADQIAAASKQRIEMGALYAAAVTFDRSLATAPSARIEIKTALDELVAAGLTVMPSSPDHYDRREMPPMPLWVRRPGQARRAHGAQTVRIWPSALEAAGRIATRDDEFAVLGSIANFLREGGEMRPSVPVRERSLELFGDEKRLDRLAMTRLFASGALTLELLRCHQVPIPFVSQWVPGSSDPRGTALLIAENHHTYASLLEVSRHHAAEGGLERHVGYGTGSQFPSAVLTVPLLVPRPERIVYFGDLDLKGLQIPAVASLNAVRAELPEVVPAIPLYELLFDAPYRLPATQVAGDIAAVAAAWLGTLAGEANAVLVDGYRLPQEAIGYELLMRRQDVLDQI